MYPDIYVLLRCLVKPVQNIFQSNFFNSSFMLKLVGSVWNQTLRFGRDWTKQANSTIKKMIRTPKVHATCKKSPTQVACNSIAHGTGSVGGDLCRHKQTRTTTFDNAILLSGLQLSIKINGVFKRPIGSEEWSLRDSGRGRKRTLVTGGWGVCVE